MTIPILNWSSLSAEQRRQALRRPVQQSTPAFQESVREIVREVRARGDAALLEFTRRFDSPLITGISSCSNSPSSCPGSRPCIL
jgi:histidinol dehydrogenase